MIERYSSSLPVGMLAVAKKLALRHRVWFKVLSRVERGIIDLTIKYVDNIRSAKLAEIVTAIISKLQSATECTIDKLTRTIGLPLAQKISKIAVNWGNQSGSKWADDYMFARFLLVNSARVD
jgi:hypothetical protein